MLEYQQQQRMRNLIHLRPADQEIQFLYVLKYYLVQQITILLKIFANVKILAHLTQQLCQYLSLIHI